MSNVAFLFTGVGNLEGGGGAERFFSDFFDQYQKSNPNFKLFFISDKRSVKNFNTIGSLKETKYVKTYSIISNRFKNKIEALQLTKLIVRFKIKLIQIPLYNTHYFPLIQAIDRLPAFIRPKITLTITDSFVPYYYFEDGNRGYNFRNILEPLFQKIKIDSVISWYTLFKEFSEKNNLIQSKPEVFCISSRYSGKIFNTSSPKKNIILYAGRLTIAKRPLLFIEALAILKKKNFNLSGWSFFVYGKGNLENEIRSKIKEYDLENIITLTNSVDLTKVFEESKCFVSTQDFENFPSLAMNEAMAAGNSIISRNVGQTDLFVKDGVNGFLLKEDNAQGLSNVIENYLTHPELHEKMGKESIKLTQEVHTFSNFKTQIESFWEKTLSSK